MLGFIFGFNMRLGRLQYFLASLGLGVAFVVLAVVMIMGLAAVGGQKPSLAMTWPILAMIGLFVIANLMLQAMRFRDIGWDPVCVIPAWIAIMVLDYVIAGRFPEYAASSSHHGTWVGGLINLGLSVALLFFPSGADDAQMSGASPVSHAPSASFRSPRSAGSATEAGLARITSGDAGRRGW
ncbi:hypothetical protein SSBR45G_35950 [Bradyrhizobium sp. SSBR45G]|uniref:DUF805 domain-containing protein n=1 Tax=unclassified Bradyrhizobium TaxID=2631580 RepID=UPI00234291A7|nr:MULTISPECIES: DUF805 domain-containing protein [unclassified Bradyrhizobium]GLH78686.1 hypothetical protein SSBR45G_35950 [Bradyrhizobium sp. SSBR45G]GLH87486.1 hypothetical protein SSBR45R_49460 [Bradyrhizobium sp. SSBR45R]